MAKQQTYLIATAIIRQDDEVLLVKQQGPGDPAPGWFLPGGRVESGEVLPEALAREVREETGLTLIDPGHLAYVTQIDNPAGYVMVGDEPPAPATQYTAFIFEVADWAGKPQPADPDGHILECRFLPLPEAIRLIEETLPWRVGREPALAYLRGETALGTLWVYRREGPRLDRLLCRLP